MSTKKVIKSLFTFLFLLTLIGCSADTAGNEEVDRVELKVAYPTQPPSLDPHASTAIATSDIMRPVFESLLTVDADYNIKPMLADAWEQSDDGKTITFHLREGVLFHNGEELMADDVVASLNKWKEAPGSREQFTEAEFEAEDNYTVVLRLPEPLSTTLTALSFGGGGFAAIMPKESIDNASADGIEEFIGTGPFKFDKWKPDQSIHLTKFEDYQARSEPSSGLAGKREALIDDLYFVFVKDPSTRVSGIQTGEYDVVVEVPFDNATQLENDSNIENHIHPGGFLIAHFNKKAGLFTDVKARQAVANALEMESILRSAYAEENYYRISHNLMMEQQEKQWYSDIGKDHYNVHDTEKAKQLLNESGYNGEEITILTTRDYEPQYNAAVVIQEQLKNIGMQVNLEVYDWATLLEKRQDETGYVMYVIENVGVIEPSAQNFLRSDYPGWTESPELDKLIESFRSKQTLDDAKDLYAGIQQWYVDYLPVVKIGDYNKVATTRKAVKNFNHQDGYIFWNVSNEK